MRALYDHIQEALQYLRERTPFQPRFGIILGTGLGNLTDDIETEAEIPYAEIPHFPVSTVESHKGKLVFGRLAGVPVVCMAGRFHYYEGYTMQQITFPVRVMKMLGIERLVISNASGGLNPDYRAGDLIFVRDHINLQADNPLIGYNDERLGPRFPDMLRAYDWALNRRAMEIADELGIRAHEGVYLALQGPNLETPAEYTFMHRIGADVVGMSTVPEVLVAKHMSLPVFVVSVVSNQGYPPESIQETTVEAVIAMVSSVEPKLRAIVRQLLQELSA
jgi:purine-nucleoside phosphorylase